MHNAHICEIMAQSMVTFLNIITQKSSWTRTEIEFAISTSDVASTRGPYAKMIFTLSVIIERNAIRISANHLFAPLTSDHRWWIDACPVKKALLVHIYHRVVRQLCAGGGIVRQSRPHYPVVSNPGKSPSRVDSDSVPLSVYRLKITRPMLYSLVMKE